MIDDRLAAGLRAALARRDPGGMSPGLEAAVVASLRRDRRPAPLAVLRGPLVRIAAAAAVVAVVAIGLSVGTLRIAGPAASAAPAPIPSPRLVQSGDGIVEPPAGPWIQAALAVAVVVGLGWIGYRARNRAVLVGAVLGIVGIVWVGSMIGRGDALTTDSGSFGARPIVPKSDPSTGGYTIAAVGDTRFEVVFTITNESDLPVRILGLRRENDFDAFVGPRYTALGAWPEMDGCCLPEHAVGFEPVTIAAHRQLDLVAVGQTGPCATTDTSGGGYSGFNSVPLVYEQLTVVYSVDVPLQGEIRIPTVDNCPPPVSSPTRASRGP